MAKDFIKQYLADSKSPTEYIYRLNVMRCVINDLIRDFDKEYGWCVGCHGYSKLDEAKKTEDDNGIILRCSKCNNIVLIKH